MGLSRKSEIFGKQQKLDTKTDNSPKTKRAKSLPLRLLLIIPFSVQVFGAVGLVGYLSFQNGQKSVENLAEQLMLEVGNRISERIETYFATPHIVNQLNQEALELGHLDLENLHSMEQHFWRQSQIFELVSYIQFGNVQGEFVGLAVNDDGTFRYQVTEFTGALQTYTIDKQGNRGEFLETSPNFDSRLRPWYIVPQQADRPAWTEIYPWVNPPTLAITLGQPYYDRAGKFQGILATDLTLAQISDFLNNLKIGDTGQTFILEPSGLLVATSVTELPFKLEEETPKRLLAADSQNPLTSETVGYLQEYFGDLTKIKTQTTLRFQIERKRYFLQVNPLQDEHGLNWLGVIVIPESDFMAQINANTRISILLCVSALGLATISGLYTSFWITQPIDKLIKASRAIAAGNLAQTIDITGVKEIGTLTSSFNQMAKQLQVSFAILEKVNEDLEGEIKERKQIEEQLRHNSLHDALTNFPNRTFLMEHLELALKRMQREKNYLFAVLFIDLDRFKVINDSLGHQVGDQLLVAITHKFATIVRASDMIARLGGDEFVILLDPIKNIRDAIRIAERINKELQSPLELETCQVFTTASIGIVLSSTNYHQGSELLRDADIAMYRAKTRGKARYELFDQEMYDQALMRLQLEHDLYKALENQEFQVYYQAIVSLETGKITGFEALMRWLHPKKGLISPAKFLPIAEETGLILSIGESILYSACQQMSQWQTRFSMANSLTISVNLSVKQLKDPSFLEKVDKILHQTSLEGKSLQLEITESMLMENLDELKDILWQLKAREIDLSIDDFGTGYSSLSYLHRLPIKNLKIDRSFISSMGQEQDSRDIVQIIINLARQLDMTMIAEGIESSEQLNQLKVLKCDRAQGFLLSKPLPPNEAEKLLGDLKVDTLTNFLAQ